MSARKQGVEHFTVPEHEIPEGLVAFGENDRGTYYVDPATRRVYHDGGGTRWSSFRLFDVLVEEIEQYARELGWTREGTGGGCDVLALNDGDGLGWWWLSAHDGGEVPQDWGKCLVGRYDPEGECVGFWYLADVKAALRTVGEVMDVIRSQEAMQGHGCSQGEIVEAMWAAVDELRPNEPAELTRDEQREIAKDVQGDQQNDDARGK